ncbi:MAG: hypothetical protein ACRDMX_00485 [Solirubrobacteraceae bacterium]
MRKLLVFVGAVLVIVGIGIANAAGARIYVANDVCTGGELVGQS